MLTVETAADLASHVGEELGRSDWVAVTQQMIDGFAEVTGDDHWIHVDTERASREMPGGQTIAHGLLVLSLMPRLLREIYKVRKRGMGLNYGYDRVRFVSQVPAGSRVRLILKLEAIEAHTQGTRIVTEATFEIEGGERPALVARNILLLRDP